jgi:hypothetical protein
MRCLSRRFISILLFSCAFSLHATDRFVSLTSPNSAPPYTNWDTAAHVIQDAIDAAAPGDTITVTNGVYNVGGHVVNGTVTNRIAVTIPLTIQSVNGPAATIIEGYPVPITNGTIRVAYITTNTTLIGLTIARGSVQTNTSGDPYDTIAGGVMCESFTNSVLSNCVITANSAYMGGGVAAGEMFHCIVSSNFAFNGGGSFSSTMDHCALSHNYAVHQGGGVIANSGIGHLAFGYFSYLSGCTLVGNSTAGVGGAANAATLCSCILIGNQSATGGGGAYSSVLYNCTVVSNTAPMGAGVRYSTNANCIIYYNNGPNIDGDGAWAGSFSTCTTPIPPNYSTGDFDSPPSFVNPAAGDFHLKPASPCINTGDNSFLAFINDDYPDPSQAFPVELTNDLDNNPRVGGGTVDVGAYEFQSNIHYVSQSSTNPVAPYSNWATAATVIQDAVDAANPGDLVLVTNGIYNTGGHVVTNTLDNATNRVSITKPLTVQSVNGPSVTIIEGRQSPGDSNAVRGVYLTNNSTLIGFTVTLGASTNGDGGGIFCESLTNSVISNCVITANSAEFEGGGVFQGTLDDCVVSSNSVNNAFGMGGGVFESTAYHCTFICNIANYEGGGAWGNSGIASYEGYEPSLIDCRLIGNSAASDGGGASDQTLIDCLLVNNQAGQNGGGASTSLLFNCTVVSNSAPQGAGIGGSAARNCILYYNNGDNFSGIGGGGPGPAYYTCTTPLPPYWYGNFTNEPSFVNPSAGDFRLQPNSPCVNSGNNALVTVTNNFDNTPEEYLTIVTNDLDGNARIVGGTVDVGAYEFQRTIHYVNQLSTNPVPPYSDWTTAATKIQDAVDAANSGDFVLVTNGTYNTGGRVAVIPYDTTTNRVTIDKSLTVQSVNGPSTTIIQGYQVPGMTNGTGAVRGVYMTNDTTLIGFTITQGATENSVGGGVFCANLTNSVLSNCVIIANSASTSAGGIAKGALYDCVIASNSVTSDNFGYGGGAVLSTANHCLFIGNHAYQGGAADPQSGPFVENEYQPPLINCTLIGNSAVIGGGVHVGVLINCLLVNNQASQRGGGANSCTLYNCTVVSNSAPIGAGIDSSLSMNSIVYYNNGQNVSGIGNGGRGFYDCSTPMLGEGFGNFTNEPSFVNPAAGDFHLQANSPCINAAGNNYLTVTNSSYTNFVFEGEYYILNTNDLDGNPRIAGGTVDVGAYEYQSPASIISYAWLLQNGFATDGSADFADPDNDGMNNFQEWRAGTSPTDATSLLQLSVPIVNPAGLTLSWQSQTNVTYYLQRSAALSAPFSTIQSNIIGQTGTTSVTDTNAVGVGPFFYRVGVQ